MSQVTDYNVANAAGSVVRAELNLILDAIKTCNAGTQNDLGTTSPCQLFADTTNGKLKIRSTSGNNAAAQATFFEIGDLDSANLGLLSRSGGTLNGQLLIDDSTSSSTPALAFDGDEDLGLFRASSNVMGFSSGGTQQMQFDANGITLYDRNEIRLRETASNGTHHVAVRSPASLGSNVTLTLPTTDGSNGQVLKTDGSGNLSFGSIASTFVTGALFTIGSTSISRGNTITALAGMHQIAPASNNNYSLGTSSLRWSNIYTNDLNLSNEGGVNDVDGTWGSYTIQEGKDALFLLNKRNGKKYKFNLTEVA